MSRNSVERRNLSSSSSRWFLNSKKTIMKIFRFSLATLAFYCCIGQSCSQQTAGDISLKRTFQATTPCNDAVKEMLGIPADFNCEMIRWDLSLYNDAKKNPSSYDLVCTYGLAKQGTRGFKEGAKTIELKGKWLIEKRNADKNNDIIISLIADNSPVTLSFLQPGQHLLHLLHKNKQLVNGTAAWSYTLNATDAPPVTTGKFTSRMASSTLPGNGSDTVGIFYGRTPCYKALTGINNITTEGCQAIKCRLVLLQNPKTHTPTDFIIQTIYVGKGDNKYTVTGTWKLLQGTIDNPGAVVYQLLPEQNKPGEPLLLWKADNNILYFLDNGTNLLVGNNYCSYTLNRSERK